MNNEKNSDDIIDTLKAKITKLKEENKREIFKPITSCKFTLLNQEYNILTMPFIDLLALYSLLANMVDSSNDTIEMAGYKLFDWITDINNKMNDLSYIAKAKQIKTLETTLDNLVSEERKKTNKLNDIAATLANM